MNALIKPLAVIAILLLSVGYALATMPPGSWYQPLSEEDTAKGITELMHAASFGDVERVRELLSNGANPNQKDKDEWTAIHYACLGGESTGWSKEMSHLEVLKLLVEAGADVNARANSSASGESKETPLSLAAAIGQTDWVRFLLVSGADPNIPGALGPIIPATAETGHTDKEAAEIITLLAQAGGNIHAKNWRGETAMEVARATHRKSVILAIKKIEGRKSPMTPNKN